MRKKGFTVLELLIVIVILGVLALIAVPLLLHCAQKAKEGVIKGNVSAAASTSTTYLTVEGYDGQASAEYAAEGLNAGGDGKEGSLDDPKSPFDEKKPAYVLNGSGPGQVQISGDADLNYILIKGYGKEGRTAVSTKTIKGFNEAEGL